MECGCCVPAGYVPLAAEMGYEYVEVPVWDLFPEGTHEEFAPTARAIEAAGIPARAFNYLVPPTLPIVGPALDIERLRRYMAVAAERAASLGGSLFVLGSGPARRVPNGSPRSTAVEQFRTFARIAAGAAERHGMVVALEGIHRNETSFFHTLQEAVEHAREIDLPAVAVLAGAYPMPMEAEPFWHLRLAADAVKAVDRGEMTATVEIDFHQEGVAAVQNAIKLVRGETLPPNPVIGQRMLEHTP